MASLSVYHIPVCPFSQRLEILLSLKGRRSDVDFHVVDITQPRPAWLLAKTRGTTALPVLETAAGQILKESLVILQYLEDIYPERAVAQRDPYRRAVENMLARMEGEFATQGYTFVMNQNPERRDVLREGMLSQYARLNAFLVEHAPSGVYLFEDFGWADGVHSAIHAVLVPRVLRGLLLARGQRIRAGAQVARRFDLAAGRAAGHERADREALLRLRQRRRKRRAAPGSGAIVIRVRARLANSSVAAQGQVRAQRDRCRAGIVRRML
jgi:glutathione S-transferase